MNIGIKYEKLPLYICTPETNLGDNYSFNNICTNYYYCARVTHLSHYFSNDRSFPGWMQVHLEPWVWGVGMPSQQP